MTSKLYISDVKIARQKPYVYCICILRPSAFVYIGQSAEKRGVLGRFIGHVSKDGTLMKKTKEAGVVDFEDVTVVAMDLTDYHIFDGLYSRSRTALEFLIHSSMKAKGCKANTPFEVISYVSNCSLIHDENIQRIAKEVTEKICKAIPFFNNQGEGVS
jgi:hypothetical protein